MAKAVAMLVAMALVVVAATSAGGASAQQCNPSTRRSWRCARRRSHQRLAAHGVVLLQPARLGAVLLPVRAQPGVQQLHQQPQRTPHAHLLRHRHPELLGARRSRCVPARALCFALVCGVAYE